MSPHSARLDEPKRSASAILIVWLAVLITALGLLVWFAPLKLCPACLGRGYLRAPPKDIEMSRWVSTRDLVHEPCEYCSDRFKVSLLKRWRWNPRLNPCPPLYRAGDLGDFRAGRKRQIDELKLEVTRGTGGQPPSGTSQRPDLVPLLAGALDDDNAEVREVAALALAQMYHEKALPVLQKAIWHRDRAVRRASFTGLGWLLRHQDLREPIVRTLKALCGDSVESAFDIRFEAASLLFELGELRSGDIFVEAINHGWYTRTEMVMKGIVTFDRKDAILRIIKKLATTNPSMVGEDRYGECLERLTGEKLGNDPVRWYRWLEKNRSNLPKQLE